MHKRPFHINIAGRSKKLKTKDFLDPLFEAISNSIHSIEARSGKQGKIEVEIIRDPRQLEIKSDGLHHERAITGFLITDDGIGFNDENMNSFCEADTSFKEKLGGKGVGRFSWVKFFENAHIESVFQEGNKQKRRNFNFSTQGIYEEDLVEVTSELSTKVKLSPLRMEYEVKTCRSLTQISIEIIEHFIVYLVTESLPSLKIRDGAAIEDISELYKKSLERTISKESFTLKGNKFDTAGIKFFLGNHAHTIFLCADKRVSEKIPLSKRDPFFDRRFTDKERLLEYSLHIYVQSEYLNQIVKEDRDGFLFPQSDTLEDISESAVTKDELLHKVLEIAQREVATEIQVLKDSNLETIRTFIAENAPQYRYLLPKYKEVISTIHEKQPSKIDQVLRKLQFEEEVKTRAEVSKLMQKAEEVSESAKEEFRKKSIEVFAKLNEEGKANLSNYIVHRKLILDVLQKRLEISDLKYAREEAIHQLIFPMRTTSDEVQYEDQNLWILNERLSYHHYLASDKPLHTISVADSTSKKEPDIIIFNRPIALHDHQDNERLESVVIVEFKRPGESSVEGAKNPVDQILDYIERIREGKEKTFKGRPISKTDSTHFFGYIICEIDPLLKTVLSRKNMHETIDGRGHFGFFQNHKAYIEVISYDKMVDDAKKRNQILFDKLRLPVHSR